jgi:hypothetical protein
MTGAPAFSIMITASMTAKAIKSAAPYKLVTIDERNAPGPGPGGSPSQNMFVVVAFRDGKLRTFEVTEIQVARIYLLMHCALVDRETKRKRTRRRFYYRIRLS